MIWCGFLWVQMYSNYLLSPNFKGTNVSALGEKWVIFYLFWGFSMQCRLFFYGRGCWGVSVTVQSTQVQKNSILEEIQDLENKMNASWSIFSFFFATADSPSFMNTANRNIHWKVVFYCWSCQKLHKAKPTALPSKLFSTKWHVLESGLLWEGREGETKSIRVSCT